MLKVQALCFTIVFALQVGLSLNQNISQCYQDVKKALEGAKGLKRAGDNQYFDAIMGSLNLENQKFCTSTVQKKYKGAKGFNKEQIACFRSAEPFYSHLGIQLPEQIKSMFIANHIPKFEKECKGIDISVTQQQSKGSTRTKKRNGREKSLKKEISDKITKVTSKVGKF